MPLAQATPIGLAPAPGETALVAGESPPSKECHGACHNNLFIAKLGADGRLDDAYGNGGVAEPPLRSVERSTRSVGFGALSVAATGASVVTGGEDTGVGYAIATDPAGAPESAFGEAGTVTERRLKAVTLEATGIALGPKGRITVAAEGTPASAEWGGFLIGFRRNGRQLAGTSGSGVTRTDASGELVATRGGFVSIWGQSEIRS